MYSVAWSGVSREQCMALLPTYTKQVEDTQALLAGWHQTSVNRLGIDTDEIRRKRAGFDGVIHFIPGLFIDAFLYSAPIRSVFPECVEVSRPTMYFSARPHMAL